MIIIENIYNFDEKSFFISIARIIKRVITLKAYKSGKIIKNKQNGNKEFILLLICVFAISRAIFLLFIYRGANGDL